MARARVRFYGYYRTAIGIAETTLEVPEGTLASEAYELIQRTWPSLARYPAPVMVLLNRSRMAGSELIQDGDLLELLPPVAGG